MGYKRKFIKPGKVKETYPYHLARQVVQSHGIVSKLDYERWWTFNRPKGLPKRPDIIYKREMGKFSWGDFLGIHNDFPDKNVAFRSYEDCKKFIYPLGLRNSLEWFKFIKENKHPADIPRAPMHYYTKNGEWIDWKDFLGYDVAKKHEYLVKTKKPMLYIAKKPNRPFNVVKINMLMGEKEDLVALAKAESMTFIRCFYLNRMEDDWLGMIEAKITRYTKYGEDDEYFTSNVAEIISDLSYSFETVT